MSDSSNYSNMSDLDDIEDIELVMQLNQGESSRRSRKTINRDRYVAEARLLADYFGPSPKYPDYYFRHATGLMGFSVIMKCTSVIRQVAYDTSPDALDEYLQMEKHCARDYLDCFTMCIIDLFTPEFLRKPDVNDVQKLYDAHNRIHGLPGSLGSIDCANNDLTVLNHSPLFDDLLDDIAPVVPFEVNIVTFEKGYYLADGIYPQWAAFVKSLTVARDERNAVFKRRQERKEEGRETKMMKKQNIQVILHNLLDVVEITAAQVFVNSALMKLLTFIWSISSRYSGRLRHNLRSLNAKTLNVKSVSAMCAKCVMIDKHDLCVSKSVAKPLKKTVASESIKKPRNNVRKLHERFGKIYKWSYIKFTPSGYIWKPKSPKGNVNPNLIEIVLFIVDSGCSKHMTRNLKLLINFVEKFLRTVKFGNDQIAPILEYGDLVQGAVTIKRVYYVKGLNHNLFSVGQFCDADLEVAFRKSTCFIRDLKGNDLLTGSRGTNLYSITLQESNSPNPICLMAKSTSSQAWL
nr:integrase, catalytic region, zinc finger, CCHC-type, peptidase aspartic, catalytic [Tanacetum cinerariifolium]